MGGVMSLALRSEGSMPRVEVRFLLGEFMRRDASCAAATLCGSRALASLGSLCILSMIVLSRINSLLFHKVLVLFFYHLSISITIVHNEIYRF